MKKYKIVNKARFTAFIALSTLLSIFIFGAILGFYDVKADKETKYVTIAVESGDTLWQLAKTYGPENIDTNTVVNQIMAINNVKPGNLQVGQLLFIPMN